MFTILEDQNLLKHPEKYFFYFLFSKTVIIVDPF